MPITRVVATITGTLEAARARADAPSRTRPRAAPAAVLLGVMLIGVVIPTIVAAVTGNLAIPHSDAWSMSRIAQTFAHTGQIRLLNWNDMNVIGQVVMLGPLGGSLVTQQLAVAVLGMVCLWCSYDLVAATCGIRAGLLAALMMALWPGFPSLATSFMTDVPALAGTLGALAIGRRADERDSRRLLAGALLVGFWAVTIREQAIAAPLALLAYSWFTRARRERIDAAALIVAAAAFAILLIAFEAWRSGLPASQNPHPSLAPVAMLRLAWSAVPPAFATLALPLAPALIWTARPRAWSRPARIAAGTVFVLLLIRTCTDGIFVGDYLTDGGEYHGVMPGGSFMMPPAFWHLVTVLGVISGALLAGTLVDRWRASEPLLSTFTALTAAMTVAVSVTGNGIYDRYLLALLPGTFALVLSPRSRQPSRQQPARSRPPKHVRAWPDPRQVIALSSIVVIATTTALLTLNADAYDIARWHLGERLAAKGIPAPRIDVGLEWVGWHHPRGLPAPPPGLTHSVDLLWVEQLFSRQSPCVLVTNLPIGSGTMARGHLRSLGTDSYRTDLIGGGRSQLYVYLTAASGCRSEARS